MPRDWTEREVAAAVADYFDMLRAELRGQPYNKSEHRRGLAIRLDDRSKASIELKHQNISAVLLNMGIPYISGYKPLGHYQGLLVDAAAQYVENNLDLCDIVRDRVEETEDNEVATVLIDRNILTAERKPPDGGGIEPGVVSEIPPAYKTPRPRHTNYLELEATNRSLGLAGEKFVLKFEQARLEAAGRDSLAAKVEHVSQTQGDGLGYDIHSYDKEGRDRMIEVKTTRYGIYTPFFVSRNELAVSRAKSESYCLCRVFEFKQQPQLFKLSGAIDQHCELSAQNFRARLFAGN